MTQNKRKTKGKKWVIKNTVTAESLEKSQKISDALGINPIIASLLTARGYDTVDSAKKFIYMESEVLTDPYKMADMSLAVDNVFDDIQSSIEDKIESLRNSSESVIANIGAMNPYNVLSRGYAAVYNGSKQIKSVDQANVGDVVCVELSDGRMDCTVNSTQKGKYRG